MYDDLTPAVARALAAAHEWARRLDTLDVQPVHVLQGLLEEEEGRAAMLLAAAALDPCAARTTLAAGVAEPRAALSGAPRPLGPLTKNLLLSAHRLARATTVDGIVASEHLLLALLRADVPLRRALEALGLDFGRLEAEALSGLGPPLEMEEPLQLHDSVEQLEGARILDASANRRAEALRVVEDYCRFVLDDAFLTGELKRLRHDLAHALSELPAGLLLAARETLRDVGTSISTERESERATLADVVQANLKRLQEALRSLEEYGKVHSPEMGQLVEALRYRAYTLERTLVLGSSARARLAEARLFVLVSGSQCARSLEWTVREAAAGGAQVIQLREKGLPDRELLRRARQVRHWTREAGVLFIVNDRPDLARLVEADGVHVGQEELPVREAYRIVGADALIGVSTHNIDQVRQAILDGASYLGIGPTFPSATKNFDCLAGLDFVRQAVAETSLPAFVIGGVTLANLGAVLEAGARRVAVGHALCQAEDPQAVAAAMRRLLDGAAR